MSFSAQKHRNRGITHAGLTLFKESVNLRGHTPPTFQPFSIFGCAAMKIRSKNSEKKIRIVFTIVVTIARTRGYLKKKCYYETPCQRWNEC